MQIAYFTEEDKPLKMWSDLFSKTISLLLISFYYIILHTQSNHQIKIRKANLNIQIESE